MEQSITRTAFRFPKVSSVYYGKVRDVYIIDNKLMVSVVTDRISAFDVIMPRPIPYKGQVLNQIAAYFLEATKDICPNWVIEVPDPNVTVGVLCTPYRVEMVIRGYLTGHAWREYQEGKRIICGELMPENMVENQMFPKPIITPTTKNDQSHDLDITREEIIEKGIVSKADYELMEKYTQELYQRGSEMAAQKGLILVDTKYEFGKANDKIFLIDEVHTPDSSRYFYAEGYEERLGKGESQRQLSKEFLRQWLIENGFRGREGENIPEFTDDWIMEVSERYIELYTKITGKEFQKWPINNIMERIDSNVANSLKPLLSGI
ncbi:MAG: phosphoribosylaminoimidazolesuccinocarboxamide synthase [Bacteroidota bacterium]